MADPVLARKMFRTLEPYHGLVYFAPEATAAYAALGCSDRQSGYFASRAAPMGAVGAEVVIGTFFNFHPDVVRRAVPASWDVAAPGAWVEARLAGIDGALRRVLGAAVDRAEMAEAALLAREAASHCTAPGRPLCAGHLDLAWPDAPHLVLWHAISVLREFRGDGHLACLLTEHVGPVEALVIHAATGDVPRRALQLTRGWTDDAWKEAEDGLRVRGWLDSDAALTPSGREHREQVELHTDELALGPWEALGEVHSDRLRALVRPFSRAIVASGEFGL